VKLGRKATAVMVLATAALALVGNMATNSVDVPESKIPWVWGAVVVLVALILWLSLRQLVQEQRGHATPTVASERPVRLGVMLLGAWVFFSLADGSPIAPSAIRAPTATGVAFGSCRVPDSGPVVLAVSGRAMSPRLPADSVVGPILREAFAGMDSRKLALVNVDGQPAAATTLTVDAKSASQRDSSISNFLKQADGIRAAHEQVNVLAALETASRIAKNDGDKGTVILVDSGLSTSGVIDFRQQNMLDAPPRNIVSYLDNTSTLPDLRELTVFFVGLGETAPPQESLLRPQRMNIADIWSSVARGGGAACVATIDQPRTTTAPDNVPQVATIPIPPVPAFIPGQMEELLLPNDLRTGFLSDEPFKPDMDKFIDPAATQAILEPVATWLNGSPSRHVTITGTSANVGPADGQRALSEARATAVANLLIGLDAPAQQITAIGRGSNFPQYVEDRDSSGNILPGPAQQNRGVRMTFTD